MNLDLLQRKLPIGEKPGLDTLDPRWSDVSGLVQAGQFKEAAEKSHELLQEGVFDVRLIGYVCFGHFLDEGPAALGTVLATLTSTLNDNWDAIGPGPARAKPTQQSFGWLFKQLLRHLQHCEQAQDQTWQSWTERTTAAEVEAAMTQVPLLSQALELRLEKAAAAVNESLAKLQGWLSSFANAVATSKPAPAPPEPSAPPNGEAAPPNGETAPPATVKPSEPALPSSYHLALLMKKIDAVAQLVAENKLASARIVADDVNELLARFDPLLYFPSLFSPFARLMARHAGPMAELEMDPEAPAVKALRALYHVDLDEFLKLEM
jgi:hypothetical protein